MAERGRRKQIVQAARTLFREKGYHATTIRDIADMSGVLSGSLYAHIRTKEDLLFEITDEVADHFVHKLETITQSPQPPTEKFRRALAGHITVVAEHLDAASVFSHEWKALSGERKEIIQAKRDRYEQLWADILDEGVASGEFHEEHIRFSRVMTLSVANWLYQWYQPTGVLSAKDVADRMADVILRGLQKKEAESV
jgi:AcrR family transcriptional regulator